MNIGQIERGLSRSGLQADLAAASETDRANLQTTTRVSTEHNARRWTPAWTRGFVPATLQSPRAVKVYQPETSKPESEFYGPEVWMHDVL